MSRLDYKPLFRCFEGEPALPAAVRERNERVVEIKPYFLKFFKNFLQADRDGPLTSVSAHAIIFNFLVKCKIRFVYIVHPGHMANLLANRKTCHVTTCSDRREAIIYDVFTVAFS